MRLSWLVILILVVLVPLLAFGEGGVVRTNKNLVRPTEMQGTWESMVRYSVLTDFADNRSPRSYVHSVIGALTYNFDKNWSLEGSFGARAETIDGQISKGKEQGYDEVLGPSTSLSLNYGDTFASKDTWGVYVEGEPLWDEASRLEGYKGIVGLGSQASLFFFNRRYVMSHNLNLSQLINTYRYGSDQKANPDHFWTYKLSNVIKIYRGLRASYSFGAKVTTYMDNFVGYSYSNSLGLSYVWPHLSVGLAYDNGGFTDKGEISLWYIDEYRRLARFIVGYTF